ncbi:uncharacterized protein LOC107036119 [Diachasma alloeum]|uniref:uncharacterized protein LOC107036119 n=1 Tax=Diachasma alloeum TaxID=454923 RepID=UPI0007381789|nr:uncharacterized protein LOC107036119 [Diachasma alloeum]
MSSLKCGSSYYYYRRHCHHRLYKRGITRREISLKLRGFLAGNMNIIILPLLIANHLSLNNETWRYGPEIRYNVTYNATTKPQQQATNQTDRTAMYSIEAQLKCWPRRSKILNCRLSEPTALLSFFNSSSAKPLVSPSDDGEKQLAKFNFEMRFNRFGIKQLFVPSTISPPLLDMIRSIVNQFHTGIDLTDKAEGTYRAWENFTTGDCFTSYTIKLSDPADKSGDDVPSKKWQSRMTTSIKKTRNIEKCRVMAPYFFGSRENWRDNTRVIVNLKSSESSIIANETYFSSTTETHLELNNAKSRPPETMRMYEKMSVTFDSLVPAEGEIEKIVDPASAGIVTGKWLHDDFSKEDLSEE